MAIELSILVGITIGLTEAVKRVGVKKRFLPLVSLVFGIGLVFLSSPVLSIGESIIAGIMVGLSAAGLFDIGRKTVAGK